MKMHTLIYLSPSFHWVQSAPARDRNPWLEEYHIYQLCFGCV